MPQRTYHRQEIKTKRLSKNKTLIYKLKSFLLSRLKLFGCHPELSEGSRQKAHRILFRDSISKAGMTILKSDLSSRRSKATERSIFNISQVIVHRFLTFVRNDINNICVIARFRGVLHTCVVILRPGRRISQLVCDSKSRIRERLVIPFGMTAFHSLFYRCHPALDAGSPKQAHRILFRDSISKVGMTRHLSSRRSKAACHAVAFAKAGLRDLRLLFLKNLIYRFLTFVRNDISFVLYNRPKRNRLTASILTFILIFNTVIGVFSPVNIFNWKDKAEANAAWYGSDWQYRKEIKIDHTKVSGDLTNFPILVSLTDISLKDTTNGGKVTNSNGYDIIFTSNNGSTKLDHETENYVSTTGELKAWIKIPNLSSTTDTSIYIYYGNTTITTSQQNKTAVWDDGGSNNFKMVQHLAESPANGVAGHYDSTIYANNGTPQNFDGIATSTTNGTGQIDGADVFDGVNDYINISGASFPSIGNNVTFSAWIYPTTAYQRNIFGQSSTTGAMHIRQGEGSGNNRQISVFIPGFVVADTVDDVLTLNAWNYIVYTRDGVLGANKIYVNGASKTLVINNTYAFSDTVANKQIGQRGDGTACFPGTIDEVKISNTARSASWIATEYNNQSNPSEFYTLGIEEVSSPATLSSFAYRKAITIDHTKVSGDLVNFPVLVNLPTDASLAAHAQADADDILFTASATAWSSGTTNDKLPHEVEKYVTATGNLQAWVKIPNLSSVTDTVIYMYYGNASVTSQQNKTAVWDSNTKLVQHMSQDPSGTAPQMLDSTQYANNGTSAGTMTSGDLVTGQIDGAMDFDGTDDYVDVGNGSSLDITNAITIDMWLNPQTVLPTSSIVYEQKYDYSGKQGWLVYIDANKNLYFRGGDGSSFVSKLVGTVPAFNTWNHFVGTWNGTVMTGYLNGVAQPSVSLNAIAYQIGTYLGGVYANSWFDGTMDEVRISNTARSADWIATEYANQSKPSEFYTLGIEEVSSPVTLSSFGYRKAITIDHTKVSGDLVNFPVLVNLPTDASLAAHAQADADDILFTTSSVTWNTGTTNDKFPHEVEKYTTASGSLQAWVKIPNLSSVTDTVIYMYYGNSGVTSQQNKTAVWDSNTKMVQHMNQDPSGSAPQMLDSTQYANNGTSAGTMTSGDLVTGQIDGATDFDGTDDSINAGNSESLQSIGDISIDAWIKTSEVPSGAKRIISKDDVSANRDWAVQLETSGKLTFYVWRNNVIQNSGNSSVINDGKWHHLTCVNNGTSLILYLDGVLSSSNAVGGIMDNDPTPVRIGSTSGGGSILLGQIDEVRISNTARSADWIATEYANQSKPDEFYTLGIEEISSPATLSSFGYRKAITIDHTKVSGDLVNFPVLVNLPTDASLASHAQADSDDILFTTSATAWASGTTNDKLASEIEKYTTANGNLQAWVKIPNLSSVTDTVIYMYYGNASVTNQQNKTAVWDNNTKMVQHMSQDPSGSAPQMLDSTGYANNGTSAGTMTSGDLVTGQIDGATDFDGTDDYVDVGNGSSLNIANAITMSAWVKVVSAGDSYVLIKNLDSFSNIVYGWQWLSATKKMQFWTGGMGGSSSVNSINNNVLYYVEMTYDGSNINWYVNGILSSSTPFLTTLATTTGSLVFGKRNGSTPTFGGVLDEVRISNTARSAEWIATEYNNQSKPDEFYTLGIEEVSSPATLSSFGYRKAITIDHTKVSGDLVNFPVLVNLPTDASLASHAKANGDDILFTTSAIAWNSGTTNDKLPHEIEKYTTATGNLQAWVKIPNLSSTTDTVIYMYYGNSGVTSQQNKTAVWDSNTKMVQHLAESPADNVAGHYDSTAYANNGTPHNFDNIATSTTNGTGQIDGADVFDGTDDRIDVGSGVSLKMEMSDMSMQAWVKYNGPGSSGTYRSFLRKGGSWTTNMYLFGMYDDGDLFVRIGDSAGISTGHRGSTSLIDGQWHYVVTTIDRDSITGIRLYVDGVAETGTSNPTSIGSVMDVANNLSIGSAYIFNGSIDEVRISNTARSASWISTEFNNQSSPSAFSVLGNEQIYNLTLTGSSTQTAGNSQTITLTAKDALGNTMTDFDGDKSLTLSGASAAPDTTLPTCTDKDGVAIPFGTSTTLTFTNGVASCNLRLYKAESATITTPTLSSTTTNLAVTVSPNTLNNFQIEALASSNSGQAFSTVITSRDAYNNTTTTVTGTTDITANYGTISPTSISAANFTDDGTYTHDFTITNITEQPTVTITATNDIYAGTDSISILGIPQAPSSASKNSDYSITLTWQDNSTVETGYKIERKENSGSGFGAYSEIGTVLASITTFTDDATSNPGNTPYPDRAYQYRVRAYNSIGNSASYSEDPVIQYTTPDVPSNIASSRLDDSSFSVSYVDNAALTDTHRIQRCSNSNCNTNYETDLNTFTASPQTDNTNILSNGRYRWQVRAETPNSNSNYAASAYEFTTPSSPTIGTPVYIPGTGITVNWTDNSSYEDGFRIEVSQNGGAYQEITPTTNTVGANISTYTFSSLPDSNYKFKVRSHIGNTATNPELFSSYSAESILIYTSSASPIIGTPTINSSTSITWNWTDTSAFEELFHLDFTTGSGTDIDNIPSNSTSYTSTGLAVNTQYAVHLHSYRSDTGESEPSADSTPIYTLSNLPSNLSLTTNGQEQITTNWNHNSNPEATEYYIENINLGTNSNWITSTTWISLGLHCGIEYSFRVKARNHDNVETVYSDISTISTDPCGIGLPSSYANPPASPIATSDNPEGELKVVINNSAKYANTSKVNLTLYAGKDTTRMALSNTPDFKNASLVPYQKEYMWDLNADCHCEEGLCSDAAISDSGNMVAGLPRDLAVARNDSDVNGNNACDGTHTVYAKFYTKYGVASNAVSDTIILDTTLPIINISNLQNTYLSTEKIVLKGITEPNLKVFFNLNNTTYGIVNSDGVGNFIINLNPLISGSHILKLIAEDEAKNSSDTLTLTLNVQTPVVKQTPIDTSSNNNPTETEEINETPVIPNNESPIIPNTNPPIQPETPAPTEETLPPEAPISLQGEWNLLTIKPLPQAFTSSELSSILNKFPELKETFNKLGITDLKNEELQNASFNLPGLTRVLNPSSLEEANILYLTNLSPELKKDIPSDVIFIRTTNGIIDLNSFLTFENNTPNQKISLLQNQSFELILKPENPAKSIKGYITFKSNHTSYTKPQNTLNKLASLLGIKATKAEENNIEEKLVLSEFNFQDEDQDGLWTANFQTPQVTGEYEVITVMEYQDISLGSKTLRLITVIDPEGYVYRKDADGEEARVSNSTVSLYVFNSETRNYELWNGDVYQQKNPQVTDKKGTYSFLVPPGSYYLKVEAPNYETYQGTPFEVTLGSGIHTNIELTPQRSWQDILNGERILTIAFGISLFYYVRTNRKLRRKKNQ
jgi:hypothetical protein